MSEVATLATTLIAAARGADGAEVPVSLVELSDLGGPLPCEVGRLMRWRPNRSALREATRGRAVWRWERPRFVVHEWRGGKHAGMCLPRDPSIVSP